MSREVFLDYQLCPELFWDDDDDIWYDGYPWYDDDDDWPWGGRTYED